MKNKLYIMIGIPGSGKSTYAKRIIQNYNEEKKKIIYVSRDKIRFNLVKENEEYFSREDEVYQEFIDTIRVSLVSGLDVIADATHLNKYSRMKLIGALYDDLKNTEVISIFMRTPIQTCIERDYQRKGTRSYVGPMVVRRMAKSLSCPTFDEGYYIEDGGIFSEIYIIDPDKVTHLKKKE